MKTGYIKLYRKILDNPIVCKDTETFAVWIYLLLNATHESVPVIFKGKKIILEPGQLITGRKKISENLNVDEYKVQRILKNLENEQQIAQQTSSKNRLISILSWNKYQNTAQQNAQQLHNNCTTTAQQLHTNKNVKNVNNVNNDNNIYIYFINKYKSNEKNFGNQIKIIAEMKKDEDWEKLSQEEQLNLQSEIFK